MSTSDQSTGEPPPSRSTRFKIGGIGGPHPPNKGDDLIMDDEMMTWTG